MRQTGGRRLLACPHLVILHGMSLHNVAPGRGVSSQADWAGSTSARRKYQCKSIAATGVFSLASKACTNVARTSPSPAFRAGTVAAVGLL